MKARKWFILCLVLLINLFCLGCISKTEAAVLEPAVSIVKFNTEYRYNIHEYNSGVFNQHFNEVVSELNKEGKLIKISTFITNVRGKTTIEHKIWYSENVIKEDKPIHKIYYITSSPDDGEKYFMNLKEEHQYVHLIHFGFTPNGLKMFVIETDI